MVSSDAFTVSADAAMLQYVYITAASATDANSSVMAAQRVKGAQDFLELLKTLAETPKPMGSIIRDHLPE
jgi:hypothetical protein